MHIFSNFHTLLQFSRILSTNHLVYPSLSYLGKPFSLTYVAGFVVWKHLIKALKRFRDRTFEMIGQWKTEPSFMHKTSYSVASSYPSTTILQAMPWIPQPWIIPNRHPLEVHHPYCTKWHTDLFHSKCSVKCGRTKIIKKIVTLWKIDSTE
jgi:hypothetical protein